MTDVNRLFDLQFGLHANVADFSSTPGTVGRIRPRSSSGFMPRSRDVIERALAVVDGRTFKRVHGARDLGDISLAMDFCGLSNPTGGAVADVKVVMEQARMLDAIFGTAAGAIAGAASTVTGGTPGSGTLTISAAGGYVDGDMVLFRTGSATGPVVARTIASGGGTTTLTFDRAYTGTPFTGATVFRAAKWVVNPTVTHHTHGYFRAEGESWRRDYFGSFGNSLDLAIPDSGIVDFTSSWQINDYSDVAEANPTYTAPTAGQPVVSGGTDFRIGAVQYLLRNAKLSITNGGVARSTTVGPNGRQGVVAAGKRAMLEGELYLGDNASTIGELVDGSGTPTLNSLLGDADDPGDEVASHDVCLTVGGAEGAAFHVRIPAADIRASVQDGGGLAVVRFSAVATKPASGYALTLGVF